MNICMLCFVKLNSTLFNLLLLLPSPWLKRKFSCPSFQLLTFEASTLLLFCLFCFWTSPQRVVWIGAQGLAGEEHWSQVQVLLALQVVVQLVQIQMGVNTRHRAYTVGSEHKKHIAYTNGSEHTRHRAYTCGSEHTRQMGVNKKAQSLHRWEWTHDTEPTQMGVNTRHREWTHKTHSLHRGEWIHKTQSERSWGWPLGCRWSQLAGHKRLTDLVETSAEQLLTVDDALVVLLHLDDASQGLDQQSAPRNRIPA